MNYIYIRKENLTFPMLKSKCVLQGSLGALEIILGSLGYVGVTIIGLTEEAAAFEANRQIDQSVAYSMMLGYSLCAVAIADGLGLIAGAFNEKSQSPIFLNVAKNLIIDPMVDVGNGLSDEKKKQRMRK